MKNRSLFGLAFAGALLMQMPVRAQQARVDSYTKDDLLGRAHRSGDKPLSSEILEHYPNHYTMLVTRHADGQSELHDHFADVLIILEGQGRLVTGGTMVGSKETAAGEHRGDGIDGGDVRLLRTGDIVHIPAKLPHQVRLTPGGTITYFVVKAAENYVDASLNRLLPVSGASP